MNTATNQLINAGTLATNGTGVIAKGSAMKRGAIQMSMGELIEINTRGEDINKSIKQLDFPAPSSVLMSLLQFLNDQADSLSTVTEIMTGHTKSDTTATAASIAQTEAVKLFTDIQKAYHISLGEEFSCMKMMFSVFLDESKLIDYAGQAPFQISRKDYMSKLIIVPVADPNVVNKQEIVGKAEYVLNLIKNDPYLSQSPEALLLGTTNLLEAIGVAPKKIEEIRAIYNISVQNASNQQAAAQEQEQIVQEQQQIAAQNLEQMATQQQQQGNLEDALNEVEKKEKGGE